MTYDTGLAYSSSRPPKVRRTTHNLWVLFDIDVICLNKNDKNVRAISLQLSFLHPLNRD